MRGKTTKSEIKKKLRSPKKTRKVLKQKKNPKNGEKKERKMKEQHKHEKIGKKKKNPQIHPPEKLTKTPKFAVFGSEKRGEKGAIAQKRRPVIGPP